MAYTVLRHSSASVEVICLEETFAVYDVLQRVQKYGVSAKGHEWTRCVEGVSTKLGLGRGLPRKLFDLI